MALLKKQPKSNVDALRAQRDNLAGRLQQSERRAAGMDPLDQWEELSLLTSEIASLERAIATADERIAVAEREQAAGAVAERDADRAERAAAARLALEVKAREVFDAAQALDNGLLAELWAAARELGAAGAIPAPSAAVALRLAGAVDAALAQWRVHQPTWLGLPEPMTAEQSALLDRTTAVAVAEARLAALKDLRNRAAHGAARPDDALLMTAAHGVQGTRLALLKLTEPDLDPDEALARSCTGVAELAEWYGSVRQAKDDAARKAAATPGALLA